MSPLERAGFMAHARTPFFARRIASARIVIERALSLGAAYAACSWGKDSVALTHLAQGIRPDIPVVFFCSDEQDLLDDYQAVSAAYRAAHPATVYREIWESGDRVPDKVGAAALWKELPVALVGLRAEESASRRMLAKRLGSLHRYGSGAKAGSWACWPLLDWTWRDVWAYICHYDLPYLSSYDDPANEDRQHSRTCNLVAKEIAYGPKGANMGRIAILRARNKAYFNILARDYPEIARLS